MSACPTPLAVLLEKPIEVFRALDIASRMAPLEPHPVPQGDGSRHRPPFSSLLFGCGHLEGFAAQRVACRRHPPRVRGKVDDRMRNMSVTRGDLATHV